MDRLKDAFISISIMNHPSTGDARVYLHGRLDKEFGVEPYTWEAEIPQMVVGSELSWWIKQAMETVIEGL